MDLSGRLLAGPAELPRGAYLESPMSRLLIVAGIILVAAGLLWPFLSRLGLGHLPGDIVIRRPGFTFAFPLTTGLIVSAVLTLLLWLLRR